jgi:hypothetical protein
VNFKKTDRNTPAFNVLSTLGFVDDPAGGMAIALAPASLRCDFIETRCAACTQRQPGAAAYAVVDAPPSEIF